MLRSPVAIPGLEDTQGILISNLFVFYWFCFAAPHLLLGCDFFLRYFLSAEG